MVPVGISARKNHQDANDEKGYKNYVLVLQLFHPLIIFEFMLIIYNLTEAI